MGVVPGFGLVFLCAREGQQPLSTQRPSASPSTPVDSPPSPQLLPPHCSTHHVGSRDRDAARTLLQGGGGAGGRGGGQLVFSGASLVLEVWGRQCAHCTAQALHTRFHAHLRGFVNHVKRIQVPARDRGNQGQLAPPPASAPATRPARGCSPCSCSPPAALARAKRLNLMQHECVVVGGRWVGRVGAVRTPRRTGRPGPG